jgi:uncharacterized OB-fold protein
MPAADRRLASRTRTAAGQERRADPAGVAFTDERSFVYAAGMELAGLFTSAAGAVRLLGTRCPACGTVAFPSRAVCGGCGCRTLEPAELSGQGRVHAFTTVRTPPAGFDGPYLAAVVDLDEGPRVFATLTAEPPGAGGARVLAVPARVREGKPGFAFEPVP